ncbi:MAG: rhomboid family intramembrane serine protease [Desulfuromonadales bacterium]|nr:rhomboid family intramembrane serine protease [Desulfuromonadales bacterium]
MNDKNRQITGREEGETDTSTDPLEDRLLSQEEWRPLPADFTPGSTVILSEKQTRLWALTLDARNIPYRVEVDGDGWQILVPPDILALTVEELRIFEEKNRNWPPPLPPAAPEADNLLITLSVLLLIAIFHNLTRLDFGVLNLSTADWISYGNADAGAIMSGQWWRAVTALTLHADGLHLLGNLTIGGFFIIFLCRTLGSGLGWSLLLASGTLGNFLNAWVQSPRHHSVGASTTVFGAVGLLAAINLLDHQQNLRRRWYLPLAAALALLALLGSEGENTDIGAHLFGFGVGIGLGLATSFLLIGKGRPGHGLNALLALACLGLVSGAWWAALHSF